MVSQMSGLVKNFNIGIFLDTINVINAKLCMMVLHIELYLFITLSVILTFITFIKITAVSNRFNWKKYFLIHLILNFVALFSTSSRLWISHYFSLWRIFKGDNCHVSWFDENFIVGFFQGHCSSEVFQTLR